MRCQGAKIGKMRQMSWVEIKIANHLLTEQTLGEQRCKAGCFPLGAFLTLDDLVLAAAASSSNGDNGDSDSDGDDREERDEGTGGRHGMFMELVMVVTVSEVPRGMW
ncbi:hypothetical protein GH733_019232 [Mirounga leonina]|nr:hypothetical protein GH733_019232 [Mirounga leonina]